jgi:hypothetical protein
MLNFNPGLALTFEQPARMGFNINKGLLYFLALFDIIQLICLTNCEASLFEEYQ